MSRIRSIHPGMMTDEAYMALSFAARLLLAGVWIESDDHGVFAWKPLTLKARIFPADNVDMNALLGELITHDWVQKFQSEGKEYGVCRNFRKWQRPKKPTYQHPFPQEYGTYVGLSDDSSPPVPHQSGTLPAEGGGRREDVEKEVVATPSVQDGLALAKQVGERLSGRGPPNLPKEERKAIWEGRVCEEHQRTMTDTDYQRWLEDYFHGKPWAKRKANETGAILDERKKRRLHAAT